MEKSRMTRLLSLALVMVMLCSAFLVACGGDTTSKTNGDDNGITIGPTDTTDYSGIYEAEVKDLKGHDFLFLVRHNNSAHLNHNEVEATEINGDKVNDAVFKRNSELESVYNCTISEQRDANPATAFRDALVTGEYIADFMSIRAQDAKDLAKSQLLIDMGELDNMNLEKNWYDQEAQKGLNMAGKTFFITGDGVTVDDRWCLAIFYNIELVQSFDADADLYQEVRDGKWTVSRMLEIMEGTAQDLDGDGQVATYRKDRYGYMAGNVLGNWAHVASCGVYVSVLEDGEITVPMQPSRELLDTWEALRPFLTSPLRFSVDTLPSGSVFRSGLAAFYGCNIGALLNWGDQNYHLGVIPMPKLNEQQAEYWTTMNFTLGGYCIPASVNNDPDKDYEAAGFVNGAEMAGYFLEAFFYYSKSTLTPAFFEQVINKQIIMDSDTAEMIQIALKNRNYDPVVGYNFGSMRSLFADCGGVSDMPGTDAKYDTFVSEYSARVDKARTAVKDYLTFVNASEVV